MTVLSQARKVTYQGNGVASSFSFSFTIFDASDLEVTLLAADGAETVLSEGAGTSNYSVSVASYPGTGSITYPASGAAKLASGASITIKRVLPLEQATDLDNQGGYFPDTQETALDKLLIIDLQQQEEIDRAIKFPVSDSTALSTTFPAAAQRAGMFAAFNSTGEPIAATGVTGVPVSAFAGTLLDDATAAAARGTLGSSATGDALFTTASASTARTTLGLGSLAVASSIVTADIAGNAVTTAKLAREGTSGQVLTSNGAGADPSYQAPAVAASVPTATILDFAGYTAPSGYLLCDGAAVSRSTYATLWAALSASSTVTITIASPGVATWTAHPLQNGDPVRLQTTGALPTGLAQNTTYYVVNSATNTFQLASTRGGSAINTSGSQSGTHTAIYAPHGWGDNSTTFNVPDLRGRATAGRDNMGGSAASRLTTAGSGIAGVNLGDAGGTQTHTLTTAEMPAHTHTGGMVSGGTLNGTVCNSIASGATGSTGGGGAHQNTQPTLVVNKVIKT